MVDWTAIRTQYEQGLSQRSLALKYDVSQSAISQKAKKENWLIKPLIVPSSQLIADNSLVELTDLSTVEKAIRLISERLNEEPDNKNIKMLMDSLSQAYKIKLLVPPEEQEQSNDSLKAFLAKCTNEELAVVVPITKAVAKREAEAGEKIKPIRKIS